MTGAHIKIWVHCDPDIHPEDARNAILAWLRRTCRDRHKPPHVSLEKFLIASAMNARDGKEVLSPVWRDRKGKILLVSADEFWVRWRRAQKDGREPIFDRIDIFILRNWRVMRLRDFPVDPNTPGLIDWSPQAATALIRSLPIGVNAGEETWYTQKRARLGLHGQHRYRVRDFLLNKDGFARIDKVEVVTSNSCQ